MPQPPTPLEVLATALFALAVLHTFSVPWLHRWAERLREGTVARELLRLLGEVEVGFGLWAGVFVLALTVLGGPGDAVRYVGGQYVAGGGDGEPVRVDFTEAALVFVLMAVCATRPIRQLARDGIHLVARALPLPPALATFAATLSVGPLLGSLITEPAAMTITALALRDGLFREEIPGRLRYATLGALLVNVSVGGTLTHFAAPPVLMVAEPFGWDTAFMATHFGYKSALVVVLVTALLTLLFRRSIAEAGGDDPGRGDPEQPRVPWWLVAVHVAFLGAIVWSSHHMPMFLGLFLFFLGIVRATERYQDELQLREGLLVGFFLGGVVILGGMQRWWLQPLLSRLGPASLYLGTAGLTAVTDNAALTYLGSQLEGLTASMRYLLVAGAVAGGGLTVIANAPNPAAFGILQRCFPEGGISPLRLLLAALPPTALALAALALLPHL